MRAYDWDKLVCSPVDLHLYSVPGFWPCWVYFDLNAPPLY
jgi:hypothetical protein